MPADFVANGRNAGKAAYLLDEDICLWYDDIVQAPCEKGPVFYVADPRQPLPVCIKKN